MIQIHKSPNVPQILQQDGVTATTDLINAYQANPALFTSRPGVPPRQIEKMPLDSKIYGAQSVKAQLIAEQHGKCCFCEALFSDNSYGDVEHFRPKKAYKKLGDRTLTYPGYYWLAYDWRNLMFSCEKCNRKYKRNDFPLNNEGTRVLNHHAAHLVRHEDTLLINPLEEDPSQFITFNKEVPIPVNNSLKGKTSIKTYGLGRLNPSRLECIQSIYRALVFLNIDDSNPVEVNDAANSLKILPQDVLDLINDSRQLFNSAAKDTAKFALCVRSNFPNLPQL